MEDELESGVPKCKFLDCSDDCSRHRPDTYRDYCSFHAEGGIFGTGESYEQYQVIENDFINFIKAVPLCEEHYKVHSPVLRDIIIRTCVQVEIFFKEWGKEKCSKHDDYILRNKYNEKRKGITLGVKNWTIGDYVVFYDSLIKLYGPSIYVAPLKKEVLPFADWSGKTPMKWWSVYNSIKHSGHAAKKEANLEMALKALVGLFQLHCANPTSLQYLKSFSTITLSGREQNLTINKLDITTPIDSKKYLFKAIQTGGEVFQIATKENLKQVNKKPRIK